MVYDKNPCIEASFVCPASIQALGVDFKHHTGPQWPWLEATIVEAGDLVQRLSAIGYEKNPCIEASFYLSDVNPSIASRFQTLYWAPVAMVGSHHRRGWWPCTAIRRQWFMTKIHVLRLVLFVPHQLKHWGSISNTALGPSGHGMKTPSSRLGSLCSYYRQCFRRKIHVFSLVLFVRRQFKRWGSISNTTLGPSGHG